MPRRVNLIPMAGAGQRFLDAGYQQPKPLIDVCGEPMILRAARSMPQPDLWIFVCREDHVNLANIDKELNQLFQPCRIITIDRLTEGQAATCLLAREELKSDDQLTIGACDNGMIWDQARYDSLLADTENDFLVWTFRNHPNVLQDPRMYGWVRTAPGAEITGVSVKMPISEYPMLDHAVVGTFTFRRAECFLNAADQMIKSDARIRNEFYVDEVVNFALQSGALGRPFEINRYICWGTPHDLESYIAADHSHI